MNVWSALNMFTIGSIKTHFGMFARSLLLACTIQHCASIVVNIADGKWQHWIALEIISFKISHYSDVIMSAVASQIADVSIVCSSVCSGADQRKHQCSASLAFVRGIHRWSVVSSHKGPVTREMFQFDDVIMVQSTNFAHGSRHAFSVV